MDLGKIKEIMMRELALFISISVVLVSCIISLAWYYVHKDASMKTNIDNAIAISRVIQCCLQTNGYSCSG